MNEDRDVAVEAVARVSAMTVTPLPPDLDESLGARIALQDKAAASALAQPDGDIAGVFMSAPAEVRRVAAPYRERLQAIQQDHRQGVLTGMGASQRTAALKQALEAELETQVFGPLGRRTEAATQRYNDMVKSKAPSAEARSAATTLASELRLLSPQRGMARVAEVLRDAARADDFGTVQAAIPFLRSLIEDNGSSWYGSADLFALLQKAESAMRTWTQEVAEWRLHEIATLRYQIEGLREAALETAGDLDKSVRFRLSDFQAGQLRTGSTHWPGQPGYERAERARKAAEHTYRDAARTRFEGKI